jgi:hypothetical protein
VGDEKSTEHHNGLKFFHANLALFSPDNKPGMEKLSWETFIFEIFKLQIFFSFRYFVYGSGISLNSEERRAIKNYDNEAESFRAFQKLSERSHITRR